MADEENARQKLPYFMQGAEKDLIYHLTEGKYADLDRAAYCYLTDTGEFAYVESDKTIHKIVGNNKKQVKVVATLPSPKDGERDVLYLCGDVIYVYDANNNAFYPTYKDATDRITTLEATVNELIAISDVFGNDISNINDELSKIPIREVTGTLDNPIVVAALSSGIYNVKGQYTISSQISTVYLSGSPILFFVYQDNTANTINIRKITNKEITDYTITEDGYTTDSVVMESYLKDCKYATEDYVDTKLLALRESLQEYIKEQMSELSVELIDDRIDKKILSCSDEQISNLWSN